jgi:hypothetical protein
MLLYNNLNDIKLELKIVTLIKNINISMTASEYDNSMTLILTFDNPIFELCSAFDNVKRLAFR